MRTHIIHVTRWLDLVLLSTETGTTCLQSQSRMKWDTHLRGCIQKLGPSRDPRVSGSLRRKIRWSLFIRSTSFRSQRSSRLGLGSATRKGFGDSTMYMSEQVEILDSPQEEGIYVLELRLPILPSNDLQGEPGQCWGPVSRGLAGLGLHKNPLALPS